MRYYTTEERNKAAKTAIENYRTAAGHFAKLRNVLQKFDGKCFNCKLEKALQEELNIHVSARKEYTNIVIGYYVGGQHYTLACCKISDLIDGKRIDANILIESAKLKRIEFLKRADQIEQMAANVETYINQIEHVKSLLHGIVDALPYEVKDIYGLNYRITNY